MIRLNFSGWTRKRHHSTCTNSNDGLHISQGWPYLPLELNWHARPCWFLLLS